MIEDIKQITLEQVGVFFKEWWNWSTWFLGNAVVVGWVCLKIFG